MITIWIKEHSPEICDIDIVSDCRVIETIHTDKTNHNQKVQELIDRYGDLPVVEYT
jgi:hypothetical protein